VIDFDDMNKRQQNGLTLVNSLQDDERAVLQHYCSLATEVLMDEADKRKAPIDQMVINAYKYGIALGLQLQVVNGEVLGR
jgi:mannitol-1-phosphate/altronate dehydrogenase